MTFKAAVIGGTGYGGAELIRLLLGHPNVKLARVTSIDSVDAPLEAVHQNLHETGLRFENIPAAQAAVGMDVVFLALPHKVSSTLAPEISDVGTKVIDLSGDFRLRDSSAYESYYGVAHPHPDELVRDDADRWVYGLPELNREEIRSARRVASPGCFATTIALGLLPVAKAGLLHGHIQTVACTGSSGSGAYAQPGTHHPIRAGNLKIYKPLRHQHRPEIEQTWKLAAGGSGKAGEFTLEFVPVSAPLVRGILANSFVTLSADTTESEIEALYRETYEDSAFVRLVQGRHADVVSVKGSMWVDVSWTLGDPFEGTRQLVATSTLDNLVKGGAGQAVQSMNLVLGLPEREGIDAPALWP